MRERTHSLLAYAGAALVLAIAVLVPFKLFGTFTNLVGYAGLRIDPAYSGGEIARTIQCAGYQIAIHKPVQPHWLQRVEPFVQIDFTPAPALPAVVDQELDLDGDGQPDIRVCLSLSSDQRLPVRGSVLALNPRYLSAASIGRDSFSPLLVRTGDRILLRVRLNSSAGKE